MRCNKCGWELRIVNSFPRTEGGRICVAHDLACVNPACEKQGLAPKRVSSPLFAKDGPRAAGKQETE